MCTEVNSVMGLQATAATKRKHEITFDGKEANTYTNCSPPIKVSKWSKKNSLVEAIEERIMHSKYAQSTDESPLKSLTNFNKSKNDGSDLSCVGGPSTTRKSAISIINGNEVTKATESLASPTTSSRGSEAIAATTPLPPTSSSTVPEDSIAKLEEVAAAPCEPWHPEPVDCISKLQAVAVPSDPWGSISTRSTLATTLLSTDEIDDDDDDFEDDYEEEESIIPTYCPLRYHPFTATPSTLQQQRAQNYSPTQHGYGTRPNYYSEPFPQQNCSRTGGPHHLRMGNGSGAFPQWQHSAGGQQFYASSEAEYAPPQQQQTIRCAENGKSYLDLGCSTPATANITVNDVSVAATATPYNALHVASALEAARHPMKRCCEGRGTWCNTNKNCYKDIRLKIRNLSMFKLSRFRQVSEQSLYRSVLICNTLKYIDREIETETKEIHQAAHAAAHHHQQHQHTQYQHLHHPHHLQQQQHSLLHHNQQQQQLQQPSHLQQQHQDYSPVLSCARVANIDYQSLQHQAPQQAQQFQHQHQHHPHHYHNSDRLEPLPYLNTQLHHQQKPATSFATSSSSNTNSNNNCDPAATSAAASSSLHPYDHYPFRESQSGRATPFPAQPVISTSTPPPPASTPSTQALTPAAVATVTTSSTATASASALTDTDSGYGDDDCTRSINWSSVLSLSSQSSLDPLNNNELFSIIPSTTATSVNNVSSIGTTTSSTTAHQPTQTEAAFLATSSVAISGTFTTVQASTTAASSSSNNSSGTASTANRLCNSNSSNNSSTTTTATFTTLSTISSSTYSMSGTTSYASSLSNQVSASSTGTNSASTWEYGYLDMEFGLGSEFTELMPSCKLSSDDLFKSGLTPVSASRYSSVHDNELEQPAHIMVGS